MQCFQRKGVKQVKDSLGSHQQILLAFKHGLKTWGENVPLPALNHKGESCQHWG